MLTEEAHFGGSLDDLLEARAASDLPILRKDFTIDPYQLYEAKAAGADAVLLVVGSMSADELGRLYLEAHALDLDAIVEVHDEEELDRALEIDADVLGINNRDLEDFSVDIQRTFDLLADVPAGKVVVSESGIQTPRADRGARAGGRGRRADRRGADARAGPGGRGPGADAAGAGDPDLNTMELRHVADVPRGPGREPPGDVPRGSGGVSPRLSLNRRSRLWRTSSMVRNVDVPELDPAKVAELGARLGENISRAVKAPDESCATCWSRCWPRGTS